MKKLLIQLDTDPVASVFDAVVAYDGGADHVISVPGMSPDNSGAAVEGAIYTRPPKSKRFTAISIGGSDLGLGEALLDAVRAEFYSGFRVSTLLDSNGCNTTSAAAIALLSEACSLGDACAVVLAGTGPVGMRAAALLALQGARVRLASRTAARATNACESINARFGVTIEPIVASTGTETAAALEGATLVLGAGKSGVRLVDETVWAHHPSLEVVADLSTANPAGIEGLDIMDRDSERHGKRCFGGIGIGALKLRVHRACIGALFERNDQEFDAEQVLAIAQALRANTPQAN